MSLRLWLRASYSDQLWLTTGVMAGEKSLRAYAAKKTKQEYGREAFERFSQMLVEIKHEAIRIVS